MKFLKIMALAFAISGFSLFTAPAEGFTPSAQQMAQFKRLPKAQQQALAKQYGVDLGALTSGSTTQNATQTPVSPSVVPRQTQDKLETDEEKKFKPQRHQVKPFGYNLFAGEPTTFIPSENASVPESYTVGAGDEIIINMYGKESESVSVLIDRDGRIAIPNLSPVYVAGLRFSEVKKLITEKVKQEIIGVKAFVTLGQLRSIQVLVVGESHKPGSYTLAPLSTVTHALFASGGVNDIASLRNIQVKRAGQIVSRFDLYDLLLKGDSRQDIVLKSGDVVFIPPVGARVTVDGQVNRPAIFELKPTDTAKDILLMAGGVKANAYMNKVPVERYNQAHLKSVIDVNFAAKRINYKPKNGDVIHFGSASDRYQNALTLVGAVARPGEYQWRQGMRVADLVSSARGDLLPQADLNYALIIREVNAAGEIDIIQVNLADMLSGKSSENKALKAHDTLIVFSRFELKANEEKSLANLALTEQQQIQQEKVKLWHLYQELQFNKFVGANKRLAKANDKIKKEKLARLSEQTKKAQNEVEEVYTEQYAVFSRTRLLAPIIEQLRSQASIGYAVKLIEINGQVHFPAVYPLAQKMSMKELLNAAGGLLESAYLQRAEITRSISGKSEQLEHINVSLSDVLANKASLVLKSKDNVNIFATPNWQEDIRVQLKGEVRFPGIYTIRRGESLQAVLQRAGALTSFAAAKAAVFTRESIKEQEQQQLVGLANNLRREVAAKGFERSLNAPSLSYAEMNNLLTDLTSTEALGRLVINLPAIIDGQQELNLQDGDVLYIPSKRQSINVVGEVNHAIAHLYNPAKTVDEYINMSGGLKERADEERIYVIKADGSVVVPDTGSWFAVNNTVNLEAGDTIVVPLNTDYTDNLTLWSSATQIFYQIAVGLAAINGIK